MTSTPRPPSLALTFLCLLSLSAPSRMRLFAQEASEPERITITVQAGERQTFAGFGFGLNGTILATHPRSEEVRKRLYGELDIRLLRLWHRGGPNNQPANERFLADYVNSGIIAHARENGVEKLLLAPTGMARNLDMDRFAAYAEFIRELRDEHGVRIDATGLQNEPNPREWTPERTAEAALRFRRELDARGLEDVELIPIDSPNMDGTWAARIRGVRENPEAWDAIAGISGHSYTMAATPEWAELSEGKSFWQTEGGWMGPVHMTLATRVLSDFNQRVSHWMWFIGAHSVEPRGNQNFHRLLYFNADGETITVNPSYWILRHLSGTFPVGSVFRTARSDRRLPNPHMGWTAPDRNPAVVAAGAVAPDGTWRLAVNNMTWGDESHNYYPAADYRVTLRVEELADVPEIRFRKIRTRETPERELEETLADAGVAVMRNGELVLTVRPLELLSLISEPAPER